MARFGERWVIQTKGRWAGKPMLLEPWQKDFVDELLLIYDDHERVYREAMLGISRKNGKSTLSALLAIYMLLGAGEMGPEVYAAAASKDQARIVFNQAVDFVEASPRLRDWLTPQRNAIICKSNGGVFRVLASDAKLQYGLNPYAVIIDELWAHMNDELYYALTTGQLARENPLVVSITTAGFDRDSICYRLYERGRKLEREGGLDAMRAEAFLLKWYEADPNATVFDLQGWKDANPSSWIREEDLRREAKRLPEAVFRRLHMNQWTEAEEGFLKPWEWDACSAKSQGFEHPLFDRTKWSIMSIDVGFRKDSAAITWGQWHDSKLHVGQEILLPEDHSGTNWGVADLRARYAHHALNQPQVREMPYDPFSFRESAEILREKGLPVVEFPQSQRMEYASESLYELVTDKRIVHDGSPEMRRQVLAAVAAQTERGGMKISKRRSLERIDGCVSLAMTADRAVSLISEPQQNAIVTLY